MKAELYRNEYMQATLDGDRITLHWDRQEPDDAHAAQTAQAVTAAIDAHQKTLPAGARFSVLVDLLVVSKVFPRATAAYTTWLIGHRGVLRGGAFATKAMLLRASISAAVLIPGFTMKGFSNLEDAEAFLARLPK